jgi:deoxyribonuclease-4
VLLGAHESVAGGLHQAFLGAARDGAEAVQLWLTASRQWTPRQLDEDGARAFREARETFGKRAPLAAHACYLINLASPSDRVWNRSVEALTLECQRAEALGVSMVIVHPGSHVGRGARGGVRRVGKALRAICRTLGSRPLVRLVLEITAGQGSCVGASFEELADMLEGGGDRRLGVCLDTQHLYAVGLDWTTARGYDDVFDRFERIVGIRHLCAFHLNDSKRPLAARVDRHERIGDGAIGVRPFRRLLVDPRFEHLPGFLETPPLESGGESYAQGLRRLRAAAQRFPAVSRLR